MLEVGSFLALQSASKSPHLFIVAEPLAVKYSLSPNATPHSVGGRESRSEAFHGTTTPLPGQSQLEIEPTRLNEFGMTHLFPCQTAPCPARNGQTLTQFCPSLWP